MKNILFIFSLILLIFSCSSDGLEDASKTEEPFTYSNGNLSTGKVSSTGLIAPDGYEFSETSLETNPGLSCFYLNFQELARYSVSDDFIIPQNETWKIQNISFNVINPEKEIPNLEVDKVFIEIYDGDPELNTSNKIYGNFETNVFKSSNPTNMYKIYPESLDVTDIHKSAIVYKVVTKINDLNLNSGHYWFRMTMKFDYGQDWFCYIPRLPEQVNDQTKFNAYYKSISLDQIYRVPFVYINPTTATSSNINYEIPFQITGIKTY